VERLVVGLHAEPVDAGQADRRAGAVDDPVAAGAQVSGAGAGGVGRRGHGEDRYRGDGQDERGEGAAQEFR
jgi:hypothetical protein